MEKYYERVDRGGNRTALVFVHGILGHYRETWGEFPNLVLQDSSLNHCDIICWGYPSSLLVSRFRWLPFRGFRWLPYLGTAIPYIGSRMPDLVSVADALTTDLTNPEIGGSYTDLILIGHSMGGLIVKQLIISALTSMPENTGLLDRIKHVLLYATPSDGVHLPAIFKVHPQAKAIACDEAFVNDLRNKWIFRVHTVRPDDPQQPGKRNIPVTAVLGLEDNAVPKESTASFYANVKIASGDHRRVCKPTSKSDTPFQILKSVVAESGKPLLVLKSSQDTVAVGVLDAPAVTPVEPSPPVKVVTEERQSGLAEAFEESERGNFEAAYALFERECEAFSDRDQGIGYLAFACHDLYAKGWPQGFTRLKQLSEENPTVGENFFWLAKAYQRTKQWDKAIENFKKCLALSQLGSDRLYAIKGLASSLVAAGKGDEAISELRSGLRESQDPPDQAELYKALGDTLLKVRKSEPLLGIACYEKALALHPTNKDLRFHLAITHADVISPAAALHHYRKILEQGPHQYAANNAGAEASALDLPFTSVDLFKTAADEENTLAMANMARSLIDAGFEQLAKELLERARQLPNPHENVDLFLGRIPERKTKEKDKMKELDKKVKTIIQWRRLEAEAIAQEPVDPNSLSGTYKQIDGTVVKIFCKEDGTVFGEAKGTDKLLTFIGRAEGALLRFTWNTTPIEREKPKTILGGGLLNLGLRQPSSGMGILISEHGGETLTGYRVKTNSPLDPIDWNLSRYKEVTEP